MLHKNIILMLLSVCVSVVVIHELFGQNEITGHQPVKKEDTSKENSLWNRVFWRTGGNIPIIYIITPTYHRVSRIADLTRLTNTLLNVERIHWIVIEDGLEESQGVIQLLEDSGISYTYYIMPRPIGVPKWMTGTAQRNSALTWIRKNHDPRENGIVYFADDDNSYSIRVFNECCKREELEPKGDNCTTMRNTKKISIWPVGLAGNKEAEYPIVKNKKVIGFTAYAPTRTFAVDMAGFALNVRVLFDYPKMKFQYNATCSYEESEFLEQCCKREELEPKGDNCTTVLVWHTKTLQPKLQKAEIKLFDESLSESKQLFDEQTLQSSRDKLERLVSLVKEHVNLQKNMPPNTKGRNKKQSK